MNAEDAQHLGSDLLRIRARALAWAFAALYLLIFGTTLLFVSDPGARARVIAVLLPCSAAFATGSSIWAASRARGKRKRMWRLLAIAMSLFGAGLLYRGYLVFVTGAYPRLGSFEDLMYLLAYLTLVPVVLLITEPFEVVLARKLRNALDLAGMLVVVAALTLIFVLAPAGSVATDNPAIRTIAIAVYSVVGWGFVLYLLSFKRTRWRSADALVLAAFVFGAIAGIVAITGLSEYTAGSLYAGLTNLIMSLSFLSFGLAGIHAAVQRDYATLMPTPEIDLPHWPGIASLVGGVICIPGFMYAASQMDDSLTRALVSGAAALLALIVLARSVVVTYENRKLAEQSIWDPLTEVFNNRYFRTRIAEESAEALRFGRDFSVCVFDIDSFDSFNTAHGYRAGDERLRSVADLIAHVPDSPGLPFRIGGDEFALLLPGRSLVEAHALCAGIAREARSRTHNGTPPVTFSIGIATLPYHTSDTDELVRYAIGARYWASSSGGDRIVPFDPEVVGALDSKTHVEQLEYQSHTRLVEALAAAVDARDHLTRYHSANVASLSASLAQRLGLAEERCQLLRAAALLHDVGKIGVPDAILAKPGRLEPGEYEIIKEHPVLGVKILEATTRPEMLPWIAAHHEWWDGNGYPAGIAHEQIPLEARILTVCDAYDAMTSDRPYRDGMTTSEAIDELKRCAGTQFDPALVSAFVETLIEGWPETRLGDWGESATPPRAS